MELVQLLECFCKLCLGHGHTQNNNHVGAQKEETPSREMAQSAMLTM